MAKFNNCFFYNPHKPAREGYISLVPVSWGCDQTFESEDFTEYSTFNNDWKGFSYTSESFGIRHWGIIKKKKTQWEILGRC